MTTYVNHAKADRRAHIKQIGIRQYKKMQRQHRAQAASEQIDTRGLTMAQFHKTIELDRLAALYENMTVATIAADTASTTTAHATIESVQDFGKVVAAASETAGSASAVDESVIVYTISKKPGLSFAQLREHLHSLAVTLSDTQVERRLKKLREVGKIRYDKSAKGWFVVTE